MPKTKTYTSPTKKNGHVSTRIHRAKTEKICACCESKIIPDTLYVKMVGVYSNHKTKRFYSSHFHYSCFHFYKNSLMGMINPYQAVKAVK